MRCWEARTVTVSLIWLACSSSSVDTSRTLFITFRLPSALSTSTIERIGRVDLYLDEPGTTSLFSTETALSFGTTEAGLAYESQTADVDGDGRYEFFFRVRRNPFGYARTWTASFWGPSDIGSFNVRASVFLGDGTALLATAVATVDEANEAIRFGPRARSVRLDFACEPSVCPPASFDAGDAAVYVDIVTTWLNLPAEITQAAIKALDRVDIYLDELDGGAALFSEATAVVAGVTVDGVPYERQVTDIDQDGKNEYGIRLLKNPFDGGQLSWQSTWSMSVAGGSWLGAFAVRGRLWTDGGAVLVGTGVATTDIDGGAISFGPTARTVALTFSCVTPVLCGNLDAGVVDAGTIDAGPDAGVDAGPDAGPDAGVDAGPLGPTFVSTVVPIDAGGSAILSPRIAVDSQGNIFLIYLQQGSVYAARYISDGGGWTLPTLIEVGSGDAGSTAIAVDSQGNVTAVWHQRASGAGSSNNLIWTSRFTASGTLWGDAGLIEGDSAYSHEDPQIVAQPSGDLIVAWRTSIMTDIRAKRRIADSGIWTGFSPLAFSSTEGPRLAVDSTGNVIAVWAGGSPSGVWASRFSTTTSSWTPAGVTGIILPVEPNRSPGLAVDSVGNAVVVAAAADGGPRSVWTSRFIVDAGWDAGWQPRVSLEEGSVDMSSAAVAVDPAGNGFATWMSAGDGGLGTAIRAAAWGATTTVADAGVYSPPLVVVSTTGVACIVFWESASGAWVSRYDAGWESPVNIYNSATVPLGGAVVPAPDGRIVVAFDQAGELRVGFLSP